MIASSSNWSATRSHIKAFLLVMVCTVAMKLEVRAQDVDLVAAVADSVMTREERTMQARLALAEGHYDLVLAQADALLKRWPRDENGLMLKAAALLFGPSVDSGEATRLLRRLPRERRKEPDVEALDLWKDYRYGFNFMPSIRERLQLGRAKQLLERDPADPIANLVVGLLSLEDQRYLDNSARLGLGAGDLGAMDIQELLFYESTAEIDDQSGRIRFRSDRGAPEIQVLWNDDPMRDASESAIRSLIRASARGPLRSISVRYLTEAAIRGGRVRDGEFLLREYVAMYPGSARGHLLLGLLQYMLTKDASAEASFEQALLLMDPEEAGPWTDPRTVVSTAVVANYRDVDGAEVDDFWIRQDREWSKPGNERRLEHMGRMAYADVIWGRPEMDMRGWETEPGQVLIRYGFPQARLQWQTEVQGGDRFHLLHYGDRYWVFQDLAKAGKPIFYSPPADYFQGGRAVIGRDWVLEAKEQFRENPNTSDLDEAGRLEMLTMPSVFENFSQMDSGNVSARSRTVVAPVCIRGAAFENGSYLKRFEREIGAPVPAPTDSTRIFRNDECPTAVSLHETDGRARQISLEIRNGPFWSVGRFVVPAAADGDAIRSSDILLADLIAEYDPVDDVPASSFVRNGLLIRPVAEARFERGQPIFVFAEAYGLDAREGDTLTIEAVLAEGEMDSVEPSFLGRLFGGREEAAVSVSFEDDIGSNSHSRYLILETEDLDPGLYTLALRFTERTTGRQTLTRREIRID